MAVFKAIDKENQKFVDDYLKNSLFEELMIAGIVKISTASNSEQKEVMKLSFPKGINEFISDKNLVIIINEELFDRMSDEHQLLMMKHTLHPIKVNKSSGALSSKAADLITYSDFISEIDINDLVVMNESIQSIKDQLKDE